MTRAQEGLARLTQILTRMTEASRLEQSLSGAERERFDLVRVVAGCVDGYRLAYPAASISFARPDREILIDGAPDLIAQMLDKLVANAVEFAAGGAVDVKLECAGAEVRLAVANDGPPLPDGHSGRLFESMVSVRPGGDTGEPHLGLGLYIVRLIAEFHGGSVRADNRNDAPGVVVTVSLPAA
jgi:signal transduction histidine kinase